VAERRLGEPFLWSPSAEEEADVKFDWDELSGRIGRGDVEGVAFAALPRGFYPRAASPSASCGRASDF
jgi:DNA mismatch repair protein MutH